MKLNKGLIIIFFLVVFVPLHALNILVIHTYDHSIPWTIDFEKGLKSVSEQLDTDIKYFIENLDVSRFGGEDQLRNFSDFLAYKYKDTKFDAVIGNSGQACGFIDDYCDFPYPVPRVYYGCNKTYSDQNVLCLETNFDDVTEKTLKLVCKIFPSLQEIVLIAGDQFITCQLSWIKKT